MMIRAGILTVSDRASKGEREDRSGPVLRTILEATGAEVACCAVVPDEGPAIRDRLLEWSDREGLDLVLTTGGTGFSPRDVTPEATESVLDRPAPGISEAIRAEGRKHTPHAILSRGTSGIRGRTLIVNLPGSPKGAEESLNVILPVLPHAIEVLRGAAVECADGIQTGVPETERRSGSDRKSRALSTEGERKKRT